MSLFSPRIGFRYQELYQSVRSRWSTPSAMIGIAIMFLCIVLLVDMIPLQGSLLQINPTTAPVNGIYISSGYEAQPNERGSVLVQAAESFQNVEGMDFTFALDPSQAHLLRVKRTAVTQQFDIAVSFPGSGVAHVALIGAARNITRNAQLLEIEIDLMDSNVLRSGHRVPLRLVHARVVTNGVGTDVQTHDGRVSIITNQNALELSNASAVSDVSPGVLPLVRRDKLTIRGSAFPASPRVLLNSRSIPVQTASATEIIATIPENILSGVYTVSVESLLADEKVVVFGAPAIGGSVDILEELLFADPNPLQYTPTQEDGKFALWIPVHNPVGTSDSITGSVDFSSLGGDPNVIFSGVGTVAIGPGGESINWFRVPESGLFSVASGLETNTDYPVTIRAENRSGKRDTATAVVSLRAQIPQGGVPEIGTIEILPSQPAPGKEVTIYVDISDTDGVASLQLVTLRTTSLGGGIITMEEAFSLPSGAPFTTVPYVGSFTIPGTVNPGTYPLELRVTDTSGNEATQTISLTVGESDGVVEGNPPQFMGRLESLPSPVGLGGMVKFFVSVRDVDGAGSLKKVAVELVDLGGTEIELKPTSSIVSDSTEPFLYSGEFNLPSDRAPGVYMVPVRAFDKDGNAASTMIPVMISATAPQASSPSILQAFSVPNQVPADGDSEVTFRIEVEDTDGLENIDIARINLSPIGLGVEPLKLESNVSAKNGTRGFFASKALKIPTTVTSSAYDLLVEVEDEEGNRGQRLLRFTIGTIVGGDAPIIRESRFVPETAKPGGEIRLYVEIEDKNGADDTKLTVVADFTEVEREVEDLDDLINFPSGTLVTRTTFASKKLRLPDDLSVGVYDIPIMIVDDTNNIVRTIARLRVERSSANEGQEPFIDVSRTFQVPRILANDDDMEGELHVLVHDPDDDVITVMANIGSLASAKSASVRSDAADDLDLMCGSSSSVICMERATPEGIGSRWFILRDITVPPTTQQSSDPYFIDLTAIDASGHMVDARVPLSVGGADTEAELIVEPAFTMLVPVSATQLELVLSSPIDASSVDRSGKQFIIRSALDAFSSLSVRRVSWDTTGRYLYLETDPLTAGETYTLSSQLLSVDGMTPLLDVHGNRFSPDRGGKITFTYQAPTGEIPAIDHVSVLDAEHIDVVFTTPVLPSSVHPDVLASRASLTSTVTGDARRITNGILHGDGRILRLTVDSLREGDRYLLRIPGVLGPGLVSVPPPGLEKIFYAVFPRHGSACEGSIILPTGDLNRDGYVDFSDFSLFSAVYNTQYNPADIQCDAQEVDQEGREIDISTPQYRYGNSSSTNNSFGGELPNLEF